MSSQFVRPAWATPSSNRGAAQRDHGHSTGVPDELHAVIEGVPVKLAGRGFGIQRPSP